MGPSAGIWLKDGLSAADVAALDEVLGAVSERCEGGRRARDFWVTDGRPIANDYRGEGRPFSLLMGKLHIPHLDPADIEAKLGFLPVAEIAISGLAKAQDDHRILACLCIHLAELFGGLIDFGGPLPDIAAEVDEGTFHGFSYRAVAGNTAENHVCDPAFLRGWLRHPQFHMMN